MRFPLKYGDEAIDYAYFDTRSAGLELISRDGFAAALGEATPVGRQAVIVFKVDDVDAAYADLVARGATPVSGPQNRPAWGARGAHISDPGGYLIEIYARCRALTRPQPEHNGLASAAASRRSADARVGLPANLVLIG
jgi:lactoylglutathione lyase